MKHDVEHLLSRIKELLTQMKQPSGGDARGSDADLRLIRELKGLALQLVQINTNSLPRGTREKIRSTLVISAPVILQPEDIDIVQETELQRAKLSQELARASTRAARHGPIGKLRFLDEQQMLFLRGVLNDPLKKRSNLKRERKHYFRTMRALGIGTQENTSDAELLTDRWRKIIELGIDAQQDACDDTEK